METFIFVHDENIILDYINANKFSKMKNLKYVFVGNNEIEKIKNLDNVIICRDLPYNLENYPKLTSFTGWYALWKNNLIKSNSINLFEYDVNLNDDIEDHINFNLSLGYNVIGYVPIVISEPNFIGQGHWISHLRFSLEKNYNVNLNNRMYSLPHNKVITVTSNHSFNINTFNEYMEWIEPMIDDIKTSNFSGHEVERSISIFYLLKNINYVFLPDLLYHFQFDSHDTQGIGRDKFESQYKDLL
jgi:hypothetical protein